MLSIAICDDDIQTTGKMERGCGRFLGLNCYS